MLFLIALFIAVITAFCLDKPLKKCPAAFYVTAAVLTVTSVVITQSDINISSRFVRDYVLGIFSRGAIGTAFWAVVMWAGALPNGSAPIKKLMPIRGELSITAAILTFSHIIIYGLTYISNLIKGRTGSDFVITSIVCIVMVLIMTPLTVMSVKKIRKKMNAKTWKKIQRFAYIFYGLIYIHILVLFIPKAQKGREGYFLSVLVYSAVFIGYAVMRIRKYYIANKKPDKKLVPNAVCACAFVLPFALVGAVSYGTGTKSAKPSADVSENAATFTFAPTTTVVTEEAVTTASDSKKTSATTVAATSKTTAAEPATTNKKDENTPTAEEEKQEEQDHNDEPEQEQHEEETPATEPQVTYKYRNGEYEGEAEGYAGKVYVKLSIENDAITSISAWADDDDPEYFGDAMNKVIPQIGAKVSADGIDACSGATYSSNGIIDAARKALEKAMN
ncbi:DMSO/TMAO reductase YedYZ, heme-binding membrane subunit [Ruminococcus flavefaciens]|uniref:DMSO/TMAO reductase YedYZ, heme-binding membrane subunit n=1 Tax=Ruminococcus flavefaciens TaxID=1265 RepID=A0A1H6KAF2_RUMFL|nr:FMN-binding protein [Ruminococcus flavefaciens]SEH72178.1 DMSO/TMAO reductase YedYZ, heme-binding membrane subunit [Ruminococcus flavefaciens]